MTVFTLLDDDSDLACPWSTAFALMIAVPPSFGVQTSVTKTSRAVCPL
jgi:hypothetical protein